MNEYIISSTHTVETFPRVFFKHNTQDCNGIVTDKDDKDAVNQVNKKATAWIIYANNICNHTNYILMPYWRI